MLLSELRHQLPAICNADAIRSAVDSQTLIEYVPADASIARLRSRARDAVTGEGDARHLPFDTLVFESEYYDKTLFELGKFDALRFTKMFFMHVRSRCLRENERPNLYDQFFRSNRGAFEKSKAGWPMLRVACWTWRTC